MQSNPLKMGEYVLSRYAAYVCVRWLRRLEWSKNEPICDIRICSVSFQQPTSCSSCSQRHLVSSKKKKPVPSMMSQQGVEPHKLVKGWRCDYPLATSTSDIIVWPLGGAWYICFSICFRIQLISVLLARYLSIGLVPWASHKARKRRVSIPKGSAEKSSGVSTPKISLVLCRCVADQDVWLQDETLERPWYCN